MLRWDHDKPVHSCGGKWKCVRSSVEDAEPGAVFGRIILAGWREETLHAGLEGPGLASVVRIVEMHDSVGLQRLAGTRVAGKKTYCCDGIVQQLDEVRDV
jgi:hypothetical protein